MERGDKVLIKTGKFAGKKGIVLEYVDFMGDWAVDVPYNGEFGFNEEDLEVIQFAADVHKDKVRNEISKLKSKIAKLEQELI